ncbi:alpha/beta fold hydrolase [Williamsia phyllosphaerae]|uniref:Dihydrolipoamide acetyltransferase n=1 Tax=Williamsia phyllosphaerae TaxID=885042 RepID=A0ABQ1UK61_9NOCA|nr:alpha/beta hydrolase [Williamsia phyllosphaerae]GGF21033.1 dihydrolipoamide acetyltransferase [Williamsia phyllosphaerae]
MSTPDDSDLASTSAWRDFPWKEVDRDVDIDGRRVHLVDLDQAGNTTDVVIFLHGISASWRWFIEILPRAAETHRAIAIDLPGFGDSEFSWRRTSFTALAEAVAGVCAALSVERATIVGHSMGSIVATRLAIDRPDLVERLVITGGPILSLTGLARNPVQTFLAQPRSVATLLTELITIGVPLPAPVTALVASSPRLLKLTLGPFLAHPERLDPDLMRHVMSALGAPGSFPALLSTIGDDPGTDLYRIACPTKIIRGPQDPLSPPADVDRFLAAVATASAVEIPETGHWPHIEKPSEFLSELEAFLRE